MTLIIAQRLNNQVSFSSDSRISFGSYGYFDKGIKITVNEKDYDAYLNYKKYRLDQKGRVTHEYLVTMDREIESLVFVEI